MVKAGKGVTVLAGGQARGVCDGARVLCRICACTAASFWSGIAGFRPTFEDGAAVMLQGMTAHYLTHSTFLLKAGNTCLIHAAAGGAGSALVQIAKLAGATVIGTVSTQEKAQLAKENGADHTILYNDQDFVAETKKRITLTAKVSMSYMTR